MSRAIELANTARASNEVPVGALIVDPKTNEVIATGFNQPISLNDPTAHAEIVALRRAAQKTGNYRLNNLELFVTLEPCTMCAGAISFARISRVVFGARDEKGGAVISGVRFFDSPTCHWRPDVVSGVSSDACGTLLKDFFKARRAANWSGSENKNEGDTNEL